MKIISLVICLGFILLNPVKGKAGDYRNPLLKQINLKGNVYWKMPTTQYCAGYHPLWMQLHERYTKNGKTRLATFPKDGAYLYFPDSTNFPDRVYVWSVVNGLPHGYFYAIEEQDTLVKGRFLRGAKAGKWILSKKTRLKVSETSLVGSELDEYSIELSSATLSCDTLYYDNLGDSTMYYIQMNPLYGLPYHENKTGHWLYFNKKEGIKVDVHYQRNQNRRYRGWKNNILCYDFTLDSNLCKNGPMRLWNHEHQPIAQIDFIGCILNKHHQVIEWERIEGDYKLWHPDGKVYINERVGIDQKVISGYCHEYNETRRLTSTGQRFKGAKTGNWTYYYSDGTIKAIGQYFHYKAEYCGGGISRVGYFYQPVGEWTYYDTNGKVLAIVEYKRNKRKKADSVEQLWDRTITCLDTDGVEIDCIGDLKIKVLLEVTQ